MVARIYRPSNFPGGDVTVAVTQLSNATSAFAQYYDPSGALQSLSSAQVQIGGSVQPFVNAARPIDGVGSGVAGDQDTFQFTGNSEMVIWDEFTTDAVAQPQLFGAQRYGLPGLASGDSGVMSQTRAIDVFDMGGGDDLVSLLHNANTLGGFAGVAYTANATIYGGDGNDVAWSGAGSDFLYGGNNNDTLFGGNGVDTIYGGAGVDTVQGGAGADVMVGGVSVGAASEGDWISYVGSSAGVSLQLTFDITVVQGGGDATGDRFSGFDHAIGSNFNDIIGLVGTDTANNSLVGLGGDDTIRGGGGNDTLYGGAGGGIALASAQGGGVDTIFANDGDDTIYFDPDLTIDGAGSNDSVLVYVGDGSGVGRPNNLTLALSGGHNASRDHMEGNGGIDTIVLTSGNDVLLTNHDDLTIDGVTQASGTGANLIEAVDGREGNDVIVLNNASPGTSGVAYSANVTLIGGAGNDFIAAGDGADVLWGDLTSGGTGGNDTLFGGSGIDTVTGSDGDDFIEGGAGGDQLFGGNGQDTLSYSFSNGAVQVTLGGTTGGNHAASDTQSGFEHLVGSSSGDTLVGDGVGNRIFGLAGNDVIRGLDGADTIEGGDGADSIEGGASSDTIYGGTGIDTIEGGGAGDTMYGGGDGDWLSYAGTNNAVTASLTLGTGSGNDAAGDVFSGFANLIGSGGADTLSGDGNANTIYGGAGIDTIEGRGGADSLVGGGNGDWLSYAASGTAVSVSLAAGTASGGDAAGDTVSGFANVIGSANADTLVGDGSSNTLYGGAGIDTIEGGGSGDSLAGGGNGDWLSYAGSAAAVSVNFQNNAYSGGDAQGDVVSGFANILGSENADTLTGDGNVNTIYGGKGTDTVEGRGGADSLLGGGQGDWLSYANSGAVTVSLTSGTGVGNDAQGDIFSGFSNLIGSNNADSLTGDDGINIIFGGGGIDTIEGRAGADSMVGGGNADWLSYASATGGIAVSLLAGTGSLGEAAGDTFSGLQHLIGSAGNDTLTGDGVANSIIGGDGNDTIEGGAGSDFLFGGGQAGDFASYAGSSAAVTVNLSILTQGGGGDAGGDQLTGIANVIGSAHNDTLTGNTGANTIVGGLGIDTVEGGLGDDAMSGGVSLGAAGDGDWLSYNSAAAAVQASLFAGTAAGGAGADTFEAFGHLLGSAAGDFLEGDDELNSLVGQGGNDTLSGLTGIDTLFGGEGDDLLLMGTNGGTFENSTVYGWDGENNAQIGVAVPLGAARVSDRAFGGNGTDTLDMSGLGGATRSVFSAPDSTIGNYVTGIEIIVAGAAADVINLTFNDGNTRTAYSGNVSVYAGADSDVVFSGSGHDLLVGGRQNGTEAGDGGDTIYGGLGTDTIFGDDFNATSFGGGDLLYGGAGGDSIFGGVGGDTLYGGSGLDSMYGGAGNDFLMDFVEGSYIDGGDGEDLIVLQVTGPANNFSAHGGSNGGSDGADRVFVGGSYGDITSTLGLGNDLFIASNADAGTNQIDRVSGGDGSDVISSWYGADTLDGGAANDALWGGAGVDTVMGSAGDDIIYGGAGNGDLLIGGDGSDLYYWARTDGVDRITDLDTVAGGESLNYVVVFPGYDASGVMPAGAGVFDSDADHNLYDNSGNDMVQLVDLDGAGSGTAYELRVVSGAGTGSILQFDQREIDGFALWNSDATAGTPVVQYYMWDPVDGRYEYQA